MSEHNGVLDAPWFESPFFDEMLGEADLDPDTRGLVEKFARDGYAVIDLGGPELDRLAGEIGAAMDEPLARRGYGIQDAWREVPAVRRLACEPRVLALLRALYRRRPIPFQTLDFLRGTEHPPHSDAVHFDSLPRHFMCGVWVALEDIEEGSGPLVYFPGSHLMRTYDPFDLALADPESRRDPYPAYERFLAGLIEHAGLEEERFFPKKGQAIVWAASLLHGGGPITDPASTRRSQVTHYFFEGCRYWTPVRSDPAEGRIFWRRVVNVETGEVEPHRHRGERMRLPLRSQLRGAVAWHATGPGVVGRAVERARSLAGRS